MQPPAPTPPPAPDVATQAAEAATQAAEAATQARQAATEARQTATEAARAAQAATSVPVAVDVGGTTVPLEGLPRNAAELRGLQERRDILRDQGERALNRRANLVEQLQPSEQGPGLPPGPARDGVEQRIRILDERILQIERDQATTERLISNAPPSVLASSLELVDRGSMVDDDDAVGMMFGGFGAGIVVALVASRLRRRFGRRRAGSLPVAALPADDPRIERLTQAVDAIAEEVERIGEGQRFVTQLLAERREPAAIPAMGAVTQQR